MKNIVAPNFRACPERSEGSARADSALQHAINLVKGRDRVRCSGKRSGLQLSC